MPLRWKKKMMEWKEDLIVKILTLRGKNLTEFWRGRYPGFAPLALNNPECQLFGLFRVNTVANICHRTAATLQDRNQHHHDRCLKNEQQGI